MVLLSALNPLQEAFGVVMSNAIHCEASLESLGERVHGIGDGQIHSRTHCEVLEV